MRRLPAHIDSRGKTQFCLHKTRKRPEDGGACGTVANDLIPEELACAWKMFERYKKMQGSWNETGRWKALITRKSRPHCLQRRDIANAGIYVGILPTPLFMFVHTKTKTHLQGSVRRGKEICGSATSCRSNLRADSRETHGSSYFFPSNAFRNKGPEKKSDQYVSSVTDCVAKSFLVKMRGTKIRGRKRVS